MEFTVFEPFGRRNRSFLFAWPNDAAGKREPDLIPGVDRQLQYTSTFHYFI